jgi:hypothetical protein
MKRLTIYSVCWALLSTGAFASPVALNCRLNSSNLPKDRMNKVDKVKIDFNAKTIDASASSTGDDWSFINNGPEPNSPYYDSLTIHKFDDGRIVASGIRLKNAYSFEWEGKDGKLVHTYINNGQPVAIVYNCKIEK